MGWLCAQAAGVDGVFSDGAGRASPAPVGTIHPEPARFAHLAPTPIAPTADLPIVAGPDGSIPVLFYSEDAPAPAIDYLNRTGRPKARVFSADLDLVELDEMGRTQSIWSARAMGLSTSHLVVRSRRMVYAHRTIGALIHLIDAKPVILFGRAVSCDYAGQGQYVVDLDLVPIPTTGPIAKWAAEAA